MRRLRPVALLPLLVAGSFRRPAVAAAQVANGSTASVGMGENYTALARGFDAVAWNPAGLGLRGTGGSSFAALVTRGRTGIGPVTPSDVADWSNELVPPSVKRDWLTRIARDGGETGSADGDVTWLALQFGRFAIHASTSVRAEPALTPGIAELVLFGNVDESGRPRAVQPGGSSGLATAQSAVGASFAQPIHLEDGGRVSLSRSSGWEADPRPPADDGRRSQCTAGRGSP